MPSEAAPAITTTSAPPLATNASDFIIGPFADRVLLIFSPLIALAIGVVISGTAISYETVTFGLLDTEATPASVFIGTLIMGHLFIVFFRSHANKRVFQLHPARFVIVPVVLFASMCISTWVAVSIAVVATWWDVYHSSMQTFGIGRIYDAKKGNDVRVGRTHDIFLNLLLYAGPILAGTTLIFHVEDFDAFESVGSLFFAAIPAYAMDHQRFLTFGIMAVGIPFLAYYLYSYWKFHQQGYQVSFQKVALLTSTGLCSIYTWGFNSFGQAFFIMNFFHALQYFALVWWSEKKHMQSLFGLASVPWGKAVTFVLFLSVGFGWGLWAETANTANDYIFNFIMVVAIMHFWYDGFIWSVRKKQV